MRWSGKSGIRHPVPEQLGEVPRDSAVAVVAAPGAADAVAAAAGST